MCVQNILFHHFCECPDNFLVCAPGLLYYWLDVINLPWAKRDIIYTKKGVMLNSNKLSSTKFSLFSDKVTCHASCERTMLLCFDRLVGESLSLKTWHIFLSAHGLYTCYTFFYCHCSAQLCLFFVQVVSHIVVCQPSSGLDFPDLSGFIFFFLIWRTLNRMGYLPSSARAFNCHFICKITFLPPVM